MQQVTLHNVSLHSPEYCKLQGRLRYARTQQSAPAIPMGQGPALGHGAAIRPRKPRGRQTARPTKRDSTRILQLEECCARRPPAREAQVAAPTAPSGWPPESPRKAAAMATPQAGWLLTKPGITVVASSATSMCNCHNRSPAAVAPCTQELRFQPRHY